MVNNASAFFPTPLGAIDPLQWEALFAANARAPLFLSQAAAPHLRAAHGAIVNLVDIHAERPLRDHVVYGMSKAALVYMTRALARELAPEVRVNAVAPGAILWPEANGDDAKQAAAQQSMLSRTPLGRIGTPQEIAESVRWLLRDASYVTGQVLRVDGGRAAGWLSSELDRFHPFLPVRMRIPHLRTVMLRIGSTKSGATSASGLSTNAWCNSGRGSWNSPGPSSTRSPK